MISLISWKPVCCNKLVRSGRCRAVHSLYSECCDNRIGSIRDTKPGDDEASCEAGFGVLRCDTAARCHSENCAESPLYVVLTASQDHWHSQPAVCKCSQQVKLTMPLPDNLESSNSWTKVSWKEIYFTLSDDKKYILKSFTNIDGKKSIFIQVFTT